MADLILSEPGNHVITSTQYDHDARLAAMRKQTAEVCAKLLDNTKVIPDPTPTETMHEYALRCIKAMAGRIRNNYGVGGPETWGAAND